MTVRRAAINSRVLWGVLGINAAMAAVQTGAALADRTMGAIGFAALAVNAVSIALLWWPLGGGSSSPSAPQGRPRSDRLPKPARGRNPTLHLTPRNGSSS
jgi:hypothetical protein